MKHKRFMAPRRHFLKFRVGMWLILWAMVLQSVNAEEFLLGYLTGSQRRPGDLEYTRPGLTISGAITLAIDEVNAGPLGKLGHSLKFTVAETHGEEVTSIRQTAALWAKNVSAYIGPQESCVHEGRMAAAFNLPMLSYFCADYETSDKLKFPTFARSRPPDTQISKSVAAVLRYFNWTHITFLYLDTPDNAFSKIASTVVSEVRAAGVRVRGVRTWQEAFHYGYAQNPFVNIVSETYQDTRIYVSLGNHYDHLGLVVAMEEMNLFDKGEYWVLGVDIEQYDEGFPEKYLRGLLSNAHHVHDALPARAFRSYLGVVPTAPVGFRNFSVLVNRYMERPPFNYRNAVTYLGGMKMIRPEAAYLYDAVHLYAGALLNALREKENPRNGTYIINSIKNTHYHSAMGYMAYIDANGDAEGNYTLIGRLEDPRMAGTYGLYPVGTLFRKQHNDSALPELRLTKSINWVGSGPPISEPICGFRGEKCISHTGEISAGVAGGILLLLAMVSLVLYRNWRYEQELDSLLWKLDFREIKLNDEKETNSVGAKVTRALQPLIRTSQVSLSSNPDADFRYSSIFTEVGIYKGRVLALKRVRKKSIDITREMKKELKTMRDLRHDNLNGFIGACTDSPNICIVTEYCNRGSLKDILDNEDVKLDNMFIASLVGDIIRGMSYLHESPLRYHGALQSSNCLVDSRWVVKLSDFGLEAFRRGEEAPVEPAVVQARLEGLLYRSPEALRIGEGAGSPRGDIYSFGLILYEMHTRRGPYGEQTLGPAEVLARIADPLPGMAPFRPSLEPLESSFDFVRECLKECWAEQPDDRPDFKAIRTKLRPLRKGMKPNIFDNMMAMMEKYANNLEVLVDERTDQLQEEKRKQALLLEMLPRPVAEQLKRGNKVDPENFDCVTIYFSDIVGFTSMSAESTPLQVVDFLNDLYTCFDSIIESYDVYKVETIGDAYMVVSGLPLRNGDQHAAEIASMSLHLLSAVRRFRVRHRPLEQLRLRIGIHAGPVCAGVVGLKMPRYCLFGDTVNTASRMESTGAPLKIHCSKECKLLLDRLGGYQFAERGMVAMKGKHDQLTYWLIGEDSCRASRRTPVQPPPPRSSLKNKHLGKSPLLRCSSLESPKKLRFASGNLLEFHNYSVNPHHHHGNTAHKDHLNDRVSDQSPYKKSSASLLLESSDCCSECVRTSSTSCPCIEHMAGSTATLAQSQLCVFPSLEPKKAPSDKSCFQSVPALNCNHSPKAEMCPNRSVPNSPCTKSTCFEQHKGKFKGNGIISYNKSPEKVFRENEVCRVVLIDEDNVATEWIDDSMREELDAPLLNNYDSDFCAISIVASDCSSIGE